MHLKILENSFTFTYPVEEEVITNDIPITDEDYNKFFELQSQGKRFRLKEVVAGKELFDYIEEYIPEALEVVQEPGVEEFMLDVDFRLSKLELGV